MKINNAIYFLAHPYSDELTNKNRQKVLLTRIFISTLTFGLAEILFKVLASRVKLIKVESSHGSIQKTAQLQESKRPVQSSDKPERERGKAALSANEQNRAPILFPDYPELPSELGPYIFKHLSFSENTKASFVSKSWNSELNKLSLIEKKAFLIIKKLINEATLLEPNYSRRGPLKFYLFLEASSGTLLNAFNDTFVFQEEKMNRSHQFYEISHTFYLGVHDPKTPTFKLKKKISSCDHCDQIVDEVLKKLNNYTLLSLKKHSAIYSNQFTANTRWMFYLEQMKLRDILNGCVE